MALIKAVLPFLAIPLVIWAYVAGREGISAILVGGVLLSMFVPDFVHGSTQEKSGPYRSSSGNWLFARVRLLSGLPARLSALRYVLVGVLLIGLGAVETSHRGWAQALFTEGSGWGWTLLLVGVLLALTAIVRATPSPAEDSSREHGLGRTIPFVLSGGLLVIAVVLIVVGWCEIVSPSSISDWIRELNPLAGT